MTVLAMDLGLQPSAVPPGEGLLGSPVTATSSSVMVRQPSRSQPRWVKACTIGVDLAAFVAAMAAGCELARYLLGTVGWLGAGNPRTLLSAIAVPIWLVVAQRCRLYTSPYLTSRLDELRRVSRAVFVTVGLITVAAFALRLDVERDWLLITAILALLMVGLEREIVRRVVAMASRRGRFLRPVVIVGGNVEALAICSMLDRDPALGYQVLGFVDDEDDIGASLLPGRLVLGRIRDADHVMAASGATGAIMATTALDVDSSNRLTRRLTETGFHVELSSSLHDIARSRLLVRPLDRFPTMYVEPVRRDGWRAKAKRSFDVVAAALCGVLAAPVLLAAGLAIRLTSGGPVLFRQDRVGAGGKTFSMLKLRTMKVGADRLVPDLRSLNEAHGPLFKIRADPRCTWVGRWLRALSIDELPQLWNVLVGDISLVGPRPALPSEVGLWSLKLHQRLQVKPGITGMWQMSGRNNASFDDYVRLDLYYVDNWTFLTDLAIIAKTVPVVLSRRGAW